MKLRSAAAAHLSARAAHRQRLLQPRQEGAAVRLFSRRMPPRATHSTPGIDGVHLPVERHHRARDVARAARRPAPPLPGGVQPRRAGVPRGVRRHRRAVPALHDPRTGALRDRAGARRALGRGELLSAASPSSSAKAAAAAARCATIGADKVAISTTTNTFEPHDRGSILVFAVYDAFLAIVDRRTADLIRIATGGTGVLPAGALHPDLVDRLADETCKAAEHVLRMCIRALDYCPAVDITFGEYLRALITADIDLRSRATATAIASPSSKRSGNGSILPRDVRTVSEETLAWSTPEDRSAGLAERPCSDDVRFRLGPEARPLGDLPAQRGRIAGASGRRLKAAFAAKDPDLCRQFGLMPGRAALQAGWHRVPRGQAHGRDDIRGVQRAAGPARGAGRLVPHRDHRDDQSAPARSRSTATTSRTASSGSAAAPR